MLVGVKNISRNLGKTFHMSFHPFFIWSSVLWMIGGKRTFGRVKCGGGGIAYRPLLSTCPWWKIVSWLTFCTLLGTSPLFPFVIRYQRRNVKVVALLSLVGKFELMQGRKNAGFRSLTSLWVFLVAHSSFLPVLVWTLLWPMLFNYVEDENSKECSILRLAGHPWRSQHFRSTY